MKRDSSLLRAAFLCAALLCAPAFAVEKDKSLEKEWDGLQRVKIKGIDAAYLLPGADVSVYSKIMLDPIQVAFAKKWDKEGAVSERKLTVAELDDIKQRLSKLAEETFAEEMSRKNGYPVVTEPGPDVMRISAAIVDLWPRAVDTHEPGRTYVYTASAGSATLFAELRDSETNQLFGRVVDAREARNSDYMRLTNQAENTQAARMMVSDWARILRKRLDAVRENAGAAAAPAAATK